jgi:alpha-glucosidase (family GH31 glycosyl hydrolase)
VVKAFDVPAHFEMNTWKVQQTFVSPADELQYGLGQHQEHIFNIRGVPIRLHQANTNISIPFLLSSEGYGRLWNNPSLTDFNPADPIELRVYAGSNGAFTLYEDEGDDYDYEQGPSQSFQSIGTTDLRC